MTTILDKDARQSPPTDKMHLSIALTFFAFILIGANDGGFGVLIPSIRAHYHIDTVVLSSIFIASSAGYLVVSLLCGLLIEKLGIRRFLIIGAADYIICAIVYSLQPAFTLILVAAFFLGSAVACIDAGLNSYMAGLPNNTRRLNYLHAFYGCGAWIGPIIGSALLAWQLSWGKVYLVWCALAVIFLIGLFTIFQTYNPPQKSAQDSGEEALKTRENVLLATLKMRSVWIACLLFVFYTGTEVSNGSWSVTFLLGARHSSELVAGWIISGYWLGLTLGRIVLGYVAERLGPALLVQYSILGAACGILITWLIPTTIGAIIGLFLLGFCLGPIFPTVIALMSTFVSARLLPSSIGFLTSSANIGAALLTWLAGSLIGHVGLNALWPYELIITAAMFALWLLLVRQPRVAKA
jgi:Fucose permease